MARAQAEKEGRNLNFVVYVCGTNEDIQGMEEQKAILAREGAVLADSNVEAARIAAEILKR